MIALPDYNKEKQEAILKNRNLGKFWNLKRGSEKRENKGFIVVLSLFLWVSRFSYCWSIRLLLKAYRNLFFLWNEIGLIWF